MKTILFCLLLVSCGLAFAANSVPASPKGYTVFYSKNNEYTIANERKTSATVKTGMAKIDSSHLVCADKNCKRLKGLVLHTTNGLRIAIVNINKLRDVLKYNPQWMANSSAATREKNKDKYYSIEVSPAPEIWLGVAKAKIAQVAIKKR
ncbi:MAG: hypothetical protein NTW06_05120 [Candidatus Falkowbacteria bacterium]|nr:hypothetical protein [Candidatus Falkowbacteria bacterium]